MVCISVSEVISTYMRSMRMTYISLGEVISTYARSSHVVCTVSLLVK